MKKLLLVCLVVVSWFPAFAKDEDEDQNKAEDRIKAASTVLGRDRIRSRSGHSGRSSGIGPMRGRSAYHAQRRIHRWSPLRTRRGQLPHPERLERSAFFTIKGGSFGLQIGAQAVDLVMLIMNDNGMKNLLSSEFKLGADASVAAGPVGRHAAADTDWKLKAQVLSYSRARGLFAGLELSGAVINQDKDATRQFYGRMVPFKTSLTGTVDAPQNAYPFLNTLAKWAKNAASK